MMAVYSSSHLLHHRPPPVTAAQARLYVYFCGSVCLSLASLTATDCVHANAPQTARQDEFICVSFESRSWEMKREASTRLKVNFCVVGLFIYLVSVLYSQLFWSKVMLNVESAKYIRACVEPSEETINTATLWCKPEERECGADTDLYLRLQQ